MFVKIRNYENGKLIKETIYDCKISSIIEAKPEPPQIDVKEMILIMDIGEQSEKTILFPCNQGNNKDIKEETEIYYMNNSGKTIERYIY